MRTKHFAALAALLALAPPVAAQVQAWTVRPVERGETLPPSSRIQREVVARWADGSPRLVEEIHAASPFFRLDSRVPALLAGFELTLDGGGERMSLWQHFVGFRRYGPGRITTHHRSRAGRLGGREWWITVDTTSAQVWVEFNWHNGGAGAVDLYFDSLELDLPAGWAWKNAFADPASSADHLVAPNADGSPHVFPRGRERPFWFTVYPADTTPEHLLTRWSAADWSAGGYFPVNAPVPLRPGFSSRVRADHARESSRLANLDPTYGASSPNAPSGLWPCGGVVYGGMTSGIERSDLPFARTAASGEKLGVELAWINLLRNRARMTDWASYEADGAPSSRRWSREKGPSYAPISPSRIAAARAAGVEGMFRSLCNWDPHDEQHFDRMSRSTLALVWLVNSSLAASYTVHDAMTVSSVARVNLGGRGDVLGRAGSNIVGLCAGAHAIAEAPVHGPFWSKLEAYVYRWDTGRTPCGSPIKSSSGKMVESPPLGTGSPTNQVLYNGQRGSELFQVGTALRAVLESTDIDTSAVVYDVTRCAFDYAWRPGKTGTWQRFAIQEAASGLYYTDQSQWPASLLKRSADMDKPHPVGQGYSFTASYRMRNLFLWGADVGFATDARLLDHTRGSSVDEALQILNAKGPKDFEHTAGTIGWLEARVASGTTSSAPAPPSSSAGSAEED